MIIQMKRVFLNLLAVSALALLFAQESALAQTMEGSDGAAVQATPKAPNWDGAYEKCAKSCFKGGPCPPDSKKKCRQRVNARKKTWEHDKCMKITDQYEQKDCLIMAKANAAKMDDADKTSESDEDELKACKNNNSTDEARMKCVEASKARKKSDARTAKSDREMNQNLEKNAVDKINAQLKAAGMAEGMAGTAGTRSPASGSSGNGYIRSGGNSAPVQYSAPAGSNTYRSGGGAGGTPTYK